MDIVPREDVQQFERQIGGAVIGSKWVRDGRIDGDP